MKLLTYALAAALVASPACSQEPRAKAPISFRELLAQPRAKADARIAYGSDPLQFGELWLPKAPKGSAPLPVVVLIHGGCWQASLPGLELMDYMAADLREQGYAVWNLEYRRLGGPGGGYPGTFQDVAAGVDHLRRIAPQHRLDLQRVALSGHSAGGHLALWAGMRHRLPSSSPLHRPKPLPVRGVVTLAGINDLERYRAEGPAACGGPATIDALVGSADAGRANVFADTSPAKLLPSGTPQVVVSGTLDPIVPPRFGQLYAWRAAAAGDRADAVTLGSAGHFELIDPRSEAWPRVEAAYRTLLASRRR